MLEDKVAFALWEKEGPTAFNRAYEAEGPDKRDIEAWVTNLEYEVRVVRVVASAWDLWAQDKHVPFSELPYSRKIEVVRSALDSEETRYGWYRGNLPSSDSIERALKAM